MSKFIKVTDLDDGEILLNTEKIVSVRELNTRTRIDILDDYVYVAESLEQIEAQLLRDDFAKASMQAIQGAITFTEGNNSYDQAAYDCTIAESAYEMADAMIKEKYNEHR